MIIQTKEQWRIFLYATCDRYRGVSSYGWPLFVCRARSIAHLLWLEKATAEKDGIQVILICS